MKVALPHRISLFENAVLYRLAFGQQGVAGGERLRPLGNLGDTLLTLTSSLYLYQSGSQQKQMVSSKRGGLREFNKRTLHKSVAEFREDGKPSAS